MSTHDCGPNSICRRTFLTTSLLGLVGCAAACSSIPLYQLADTVADTTPFVVPKSALEPEGRVVIAGKALSASVLLARQDQNYTAVEMICTHRGCAVHLQRERLVCPCHGSEFKLNGEVTQGPAATPLRQYRVYEDGDNLRIERS